MSQIKLISIKEAAKLGIDKLRMPNWANPTDYLQIDIINGELGPWAHLYSEVNEEINGRNPVDVLNYEWRHQEKFLPWLPN